MLQQEWKNYIVAMQKRAGSYEYGESPTLFPLRSAFRILLGVADRMTCVCEYCWGTVGIEEGLRESRPVL